MLAARHAQLCLRRITAARAAMGDAAAGTLGVVEAKAALRKSANAALRVADAADLERQSERERERRRKVV